MVQKIRLKAQSIGHLLEDSAQKHKDRTLFIYESNQISFADANRRVNRTANGFSRIGVRRGDRVAVMLQNGFDFPVMWFALGKLGAVMVPININYKEHDLKYILKDSEVSAMVIQEDYLPLLREVRKDISGLDEVVVLGDAPKGYRTYESITQSAPDEFFIKDVGPDDMVNIQYTSGTTGMPKGCMLTHKYWLLIGEIASYYIEVQSNDVNLTAQPFYYMDPLWNTMLCVSNGIPLVIMHRFSPSKFWATVKDNDVSIVYLLGVMPVYLMKQKEDPELEKNHRLRLVTCSGINPELHEAFEKRWNVPWREAFGMTETGADLWTPINDNECVGTGAMGAPVPTKTAKVIGADNKELPDGETGELVIKGEPMMLGYWKKPRSTAEAIKDGWFHTGDFAFKDERGYFHWAGRIKDTVRRSGENISTVEIEQILMEHENIKAAAVVPVPDDLRGEEVKAYIVLRENETKDTVPPEKILGFAKTKLAYFKIPRYIEYIDDLPMTPSERVEKHRLIKAKKDLRIGSYDDVDKVWR